MLNYLFEEMVYGKVRQRPIQAASLPPWRSKWQGWQGSTGLAGAEGAPVRLSITLGFVMDLPQRRFAEARPFFTLLFVGHLSKDHNGWKTKTAAHLGLSKMGRNSRY